MNTDELELLVQKIIYDMEVKGYKKQTISSEQNTFNQLLRYCKRKNIKNYNLDVGLAFLEEHYNLSKHDNSNRYKCRRIRSIYLIEWFYNGEDITTRNIPIQPTYVIPKSYAKITNEYIQFLILNNYSSKTIKYKVHTLNILFNFANQKGFNNYSDINKNLIYEFINSIKENYSSSSIYSITYHIKKFYDYLFKNGLSNIDGKSIFPRIIKKEREKILSYYTKEEIKKIISCVDTTTKMGKRDYAVLLLAITYGLRNSDIVNLTFENIDWNHDKLTIIQYKTKEKLELTLTENVKLAILDYLKNARPDFESNHIFLKFKIPYEYQGNKTLYKSIKKYIKASGIDVKERKMGLHSLRHSCATNLLSNNVQLPVITGILGHSSIQTTSMYLSVGLEQLKKISLEVPKYE